MNLKPSLQHPLQPIPGVERLHDIPASLLYLSIGEDRLRKLAQLLQLPRRCSRKHGRYHRVFTTSDLAAISQAIVAQATRDGDKNPGTKRGREAAALKRLTA